MHFLFTAASNFGLVLLGFAILGCIASGRGGLILMLLLFLGLLLLR